MKQIQAALNYISLNNLLQTLPQMIGPSELLLSLVLWCFNMYMTTYI